jgi:hypothetical protein
MTNNRSSRMLISRFVQNRLARASFSIVIKAASSLLDPSKS